MKNVTIPILIAVIFLVMIVYLVTFQVRETESAFITRLGRPLEREITRPGLYFKLPTPIDRVHKFDSRMRVLQAEIGETTTKGKVSIIVNTYIVWRVAEPLQFYNNVGTIDGAESKLRSQINDTQNRIIGQYTFGAFVNSDPNKVEFDKIQERMLVDLGPRVRQEYGIEVKTLGIKQLKISEDVTKDVFARMKAERKRYTEATIALGNAEATKIRTDADAIKKALLAAAEGRATALRGQGDAEAAQYLEKMEEDPELAMFLRDLEALRTTLREGTTLVIPTDTAPFKLLKEMPSSLLKSGERE